MRRTGIVLLLCTIFLGVVGCPSKGGGKYSDPSEARDRADKAQREMSRETQK